MIFPLSSGTNFGPFTLHSEALSRYIFPLSDEPDYDVLKGMISPSGRYRLEGVVLEKQPLFTTYSIRLRDQRENTITEITRGGFVQQAVWINDERQVLFCLQMEVGCLLNVFSMQSGELDKSLEDLDPISWMPSPDEKKFAFIDNIYDLNVADILDMDLVNVISVDGSETVETEFKWSIDGKSIFYWYDGMELTFEPKELRRYDLKEGKSNTILLTGSLISQEVCKYRCYFDIAPPNSKALKWDNNGLWIVALE